MRPTSGYSVLMSVYVNDNVECLDIAIESIFNQTHFPSEFILVKDGYVNSELQRVISKWQDVFGPVMKQIQLKENVGLGEALKKGVEACSHELIARMDADDISLPNRFEKQLAFLKKNPHISVVTSWMGIFEDEPEDILYERRVPITHEEIRKLAKFRSPINHPASMFRRSAVISVGSYPNWRKGQDYPLYVRMLQAGFKMACIPEVLYKQRYNHTLAARRHNLNAFVSQMRLQKLLLKTGFISFPRFITNIVIRTIACMLPVTLMRAVRMKLRL